MQDSTSTPLATLPSACPLDCPDSCSLDVTIDRSVEGGRLVKVEGSHRNPDTAGFICSKVRGFARHLEGPDRLLHPLRRVGPKGSGSFERLSWDAALDLAAERLRATAETHGGEAILPFCYGGSNGSLTQDSIDARLFRRLGTSRQERTVCAAATNAAAVGLYGKMAGVAYADYPAARLIVVWGANPSASHIHLVPRILEAKQAGAKLVVIDPRRIPLAKQADLHLAPRPGTDLALAMALHHWLFEIGAADLDFLAAHATGIEELRRRSGPWTFQRAADVCGLDVTDIERFARLYTDTSPAVIRCGWGVERNRNGGSAVAAILALPAVAGKFGVRGGGYTMSNSGAWKLGAESAIGEPEPATRLLNMNRLGRDLLSADPPVRALFVYNCNPLAILPEQEKVRQGLERDDLFTVVFEQVMTDTARYADLVLPATTFLEHRDLKPGYGAMVFQDAQPVLAPRGEARSNAEVFGELIKRLGLRRPGDLESADAFADAVLDATTGGPAGGGDALRAGLVDGGVVNPATGACPVQMVDVLPSTSDGKIHLVPEDLDQEAPEGLYTLRPVPSEADDGERFPLTLISPATRKTISSTFGQLLGQVAVEIHPDDAAARDIASGDTVRVWNALGEVCCSVRLSADLRPGVVFLPKGLWAHSTQNGATSNALVPATYTDLGRGACFNDARVEIEKVAD